MESFWQDVKYAARGLFKSPGFALVALLTLALGIGANTAIFTVVEAALLRGLPYRDGGRLVHVWETTSTEKQRQVSYPDFTDVRDRARTFESVAGYGFAGFSLAGSQGMERIQAARVSANFFSVLGVDPILGRSFKPEEDQPMRQRDAVLLSYGLWQRKFGGDPAIVGKSLTLSGASMTVIGVLPRNFHFAPVGEPGLFVTISPNQQQAERRYSHWMWTIARLRAGASLDQANSDLQSIGAQREREDSRWHKDTSLYATPLREVIVGAVRPLVLGLAAAVGAVLLIACANVANMLLARATSRSREVAIRVALGAGRVRLVRQFLTESLLLSSAGGIAGLLWAGWGVQALLAPVPAQQLQNMPYLRDLSVNPAVLSFTFALCLLTGVFFGLAPALRAAEGSVAQGLKEGGRAIGGGHTLRNLLVVLEVGLAVILLAAAGLMTQSLYRLLQVHPGFQAENLLTAGVSLPASRYDTDEKVEAFFRQLRDRFQALPGVAGVAFVDRLPMLGFGNTGIPNIAGRPTTDANTPHAQMRTVSADYFRLMGIPLIQGRSFTEQDRGDAPLVVVVNQRFVEQLLHNEEALGQKVRFVFMQGQPPLEIVGVVGNENVGSLDQLARPVLYSPQLQDSSPAMSVVVRTKSAPRALVNAIRSEVRALEPETVVTAVRSMDEIIAAAPSTFLRRYPLLLFAVFAGLALLLASVGIYGVISYSVSQRTQEFGVRMALGAGPRDLMSLVLRQGMTPALAGVAAGLVGALGVTRLLKSFLFGIEPGDPVTLTGTAIILTTVALLACLVPAWRAARVDPLVALRHE